MGEYNLFIVAGSAKQIQLKHLKFVLDALSVAVLYDNPQKHLTPEAVEQQFRAPLTDKEKKELDVFMKSCGLREMETLVFVWRKLLKTVGENKYKAEAWNVFLGEEPTISSLSCYGRIPHLPV